MSEYIFLTLEFPPMYGGVGRMYQTLLENAAHPVVVWTPGEHQTTSAKNYRVVDKQLLAKSGWPRWRSTFALLVAECFGKPRTIIVGQILPLGIPAWLLSLISPVRYAVFVHGMDLARPLLNSRQRWMVKHILSRAHVVFAASHHVSRLVHETCARAKVEVIYPSPFLKPASADSRESAREALGLTPSAVVLLTIGRLVARKGHEFVLEALNEVWKINSEVRYVMIGQGPHEAAVRALMAKATLPKNLTLMTSATDAESRQYLEAADIFVMTPKAQPGGDIEGVGVVNLEAALFGLPIIASRSGAVPEAVDDGRAGVLVQEGDVEAIAREISTLASDASARRSLGEKARIYVQKNFEAKEQAHRMFAALL